MVCEVYWFLKRNKPMEMGMSTLSHSLQIVLSQKPRPVPVFNVPTSSQDDKGCYFLTVNCQWRSQWATYSCNNNRMATFLVNLEEGYSGFTQKEVKNFRTWCTQLSNNMLCRCGWIQIHCQTVYLSNSVTVVCFPNPSKEIVWKYSQLVGWKTAHPCAL